MSDDKGGCCYYEKGVSVLLGMLVEEYATRPKTATSGSYKRGMFNAYVAVTGMSEDEAAEVLFAAVDKKEHPGGKLYPAGEPDWVIPPGETISELLLERGLDPEEFRKNADIDKDLFWALLRGDATITPSVAKKLETHLGTPVRMWLALQAEYDRGRARGLPDPAEPGA